MIIFAVLGILNIFIGSFLCYSQDWFGPVLILVGILNILDSYPRS